MNETTILQDDQEILICRISDEAIETAVHTSCAPAANYTLFFCTTLDLCPGP